MGLIVGCKDLQSPLGLDGFSLDDRKKISSRCFLRIFNDAFTSQRSVASVPFVMEAESS